MIFVAWKLAFCMMGIVAVTAWLVVILQQIELWRMDRENDRLMDELAAMNDSSGSRKLP